jgi:hypothetical protein
MGSLTVVIQGTGAQHNFTPLDSDRPVPDGEGDYERRGHDADYMSAKFVREPKAKGQIVTAAAFTNGGTDETGITHYPPVDADLEFAVVMHSTLFQSSILSPHAGCHHLSELLSNRKRLPLAEVAGYAERS